MPLIHRHVIPNAPAWTAGNDAIVFRDGKPSHQAAMDFFVEWSGDVDFSAFKSWYDATSFMGHVVVPGQVATAAMINAGWQFGGKICASTAYGNLPIVQAGDTWGPHFVNNKDAIFVGRGEAYFYITNVGQSRFSVDVGIEWDATLTSWRYVAALGDGLDNFVLETWNPADHTDVYRTSASLHNHPAGGAWDFTLFASQYTTQKLRAGNGVTLSLVHASAADGSWAASDLANCSLIVSAAYA